MEIFKTNRIHRVKIIIGLALSFVVGWCGESAAMDASEANVHFIGNEDGVFGISVAGGGDFNGDGRQDVIVGDRKKAVAYIFYGRDADVLSQAELEASSADIKFIGPFSGGDFGHSVAWIGHFNDDAYDDVVIGAPWGDYHLSFAGCAYVFFGGDYESGTNFTAGEANRTFVGSNEVDRFGWSVASAGHFNRDEYDDIVIGAPKSDYMLGHPHGDVYIFYGDNRIGPRDIFADRENILVAGEHSEQMGFSVASAGDFDHDGLDDVIVGAPYFWTQGDELPGKIEIWGYSQHPSHSGEDENIIIRKYRQIGEKDGDEFGFSTSSAGNVNGDEFDDIVVGAPSAATGVSLDRIKAGRAYIILGRSSGSQSFFMTLLGAHAYDAFGYSVGEAGDFNLDGYAEIIIGAPLRPTPDPGSSPKAYIFSGRSASIDSHITLDAHIDADLTFIGEAINHRFGHSVDGADNWNGDDTKDIIIGASANSSAYMFFGASPESFPQKYRGFPASLQNNTVRLTQESPFYQKSFEQGTIGLYFVEPGSEQKKPQYWGEIPLETAILPGKSVTFSFPWPSCSQDPSQTKVVCNQPTHQASIFWTFKASLDGHQIFAFPDDAKDPQRPQAPPLLPLIPDKENTCRFQIYAFGDTGTRVGGAKVFNLAPAVAGVKINPNVINLKSKGGRIKCTINLPDGYNEKDVEIESLLLSDPSCKDCQPIKALRGFATKKNYMAFFAQKDLVSLVKAQKEEHNQLLLRVSGHMKFGNLFEGDTAIQVKRDSKKKKFAKKY